jgi:hypothetical protein
LWTRLLHPCQLTRSGDRTLGYLVHPPAGGGEAKRAFEAMMQMKKIDIAAIMAAIEAVRNPTLTSQEARR